MAHDFIAVPNIFPSQLPIYLTCTWLQLIIALSVTRRAHLKRKNMLLRSRLIIGILIFRINREKHFWQKTCYLTPCLNSLRSCLSKSTLDMELHLLNRFHRELMIILPRLSPQLDSSCQQGSILCRDYLSVAK